MIVLTAGGDACAHRRAGGPAASRCTRSDPQRSRRSSTSANSAGGPSHRKLAHGAPMMWVSASTLLSAAQGLIRPRRRRGTRRLAVAWLVWEPNKIWCWDATHFPRARRVAFAIVDVVSRRWIHAGIDRGDLHPAGSSTAGRRGPHRAHHPRKSRTFEQDPTEPILLACSDNGPQMTRKPPVSSSPRSLSPSASDDPAPRLTSLDREPLRARQSREPPRLATRPPSRPSCDAPAATTTPSASTPASDMSPPTTSTPAAANRSAKSASRA